MLIAIITFLILHFGFGSSSVLLPFDRVEKAVEHSVTDAARKKQALAIVDQMKAAEKAHTEKFKESIAALDELLGRRTAPVVDIERSAARITADSSETRTKLLELRFDLKAVLTQSEWAEVFPPPTAHTGPSKKSP
jgi:hypothetical protein